MADYYNKGDTIRGDSIRIECRDHGKWNLFQMSSQHKGSVCVARKNAKATIMKTYTNVKTSDNK